MRAILRALMIVVIFATGLTACDDAADREAKYMERGKELYATGDYTKARLEFRNVLQINPKSLEAQHFLAQIDEKNGNFLPAFQRYTRIVEQDPDFLPARGQLGKLYVMANDLEEAARQAHEISSRDPENIDGRLIRASIYLRQGHPEKAIAETGAILEKEDGHAAATIILAGALASMDRRPEAMAAIEQGIARNPANKNLVRLKITQHVEAGQTREAEAAYALLIEKWPDDLNVRIELGWYYINQDRLDEAEAALRATIADLPDDEGAKRLLIEFLANYRGVPAAEAELKLLVKKFPDRNAYKFGLATLYAENGKTGEAAAIYRQLIDSEGTGPDGLTASAALANQLLMEGDKAAAAELIRAVLEADPENGAGLLLRGRIRYSSEQYRDAITDLRSVLRENPDSTRALELLAEAHAREGQGALAMDAFRNLIHLEPENARARARLADLNLQAGNIAQAASLVAEASRLAPTDPFVLRAQTAILLSRGKFDDAIRTAQKLATAEETKLEGRLLLGQIYQARGIHDRAYHEYREALEIDTTSVKALNGTVNSLISAKNFGEAETLLLARIKRNAEDPDSYNLLARVYQEAGRDISMVEPLFRRAAELSPEWVEPVLNHARLLIGKHQYANALAVLQGGLRRDPSHEGLNLDTGYVYEQLGDIQNAIATYELMVGRNQGGDIAANNLAALIADFAYDDTGKLERAYQISSHFRNSEHPILLDTLGWLQYRLKNYEEADRLLAKALDKGLDLPQVQYHMGMVHLALGRTDAARKALERAIASDHEYPGLEDAKRVYGGL